MAGHRLRKWLGVGLGVLVLAGCGASGPTLTEDEVRQLVRAQLETKTYAGGLYQQQIGVYPDIRYQLVEAPRGSCARAFGRYEGFAPLEAEWLSDEGVWQAALKDFGSWRVHERTLVVEAGKTNLYGC